MDTAPFQNRSAGETRSLLVALLAAKIALSIVVVIVAVGLIMRRTDHGLSATVALVVIVAASTLALERYVQALAAARRGQRVARQVGAAIGWFLAGTAALCLLGAATSAALGIAGLALIPPLVFCAALSFDAETMLPRLRLLGSRLVRERAGLAEQRDEQ